MTRPVHYVDCDVPEGMTLTAYRAAKASARPARRGLWSRLRRRRAAGEPGRPAQTRR